MTELQRTSLALAAAAAIGMILGLLLPPTSSVLLFIVGWIALYPVARATFLRDIAHWRYWAGLPVGLLAGWGTYNAIGDGPAPLWFTVAVLLAASLGALWQGIRRDRSRGAQS